MAKDSYWFKHDSTAGRGLRMRKMAHIYGHWGKGIYWDVIEILRDQSNYCFDADDSSLQMLCDLIGCKDEAKFLNWFKDCTRFELFKTQENKFFSEVLCENMQKWETKKVNGGKEKKLKGSESISETEAKPQAKRKHKIREDKIIKEDIKYYTSFQHLKLTYEEFDKLIACGFNKKQIDDTIESIQNYKKNTNYFSLYLTLKKWIKSEQGTTTQPVQRTSMKFS